MSSTYSSDPDGEGLLVEDDEADAVDHLALVVILVASAAEYSNKNLRRCAQGIRTGGARRRRGVRTSEFDRSGGLFPLAAVSEGDVGVVGKVVGDCDTVDLDVDQPSCKSFIISMRG